MTLTICEPPLSPHADCPQVQAIFDYRGTQPDELDLQRGDVVKVYRKMADGKNYISFFCTDNLYPTEIIIILTDSLQ